MPQVRVKSTVLQRQQELTDTHTILLPSPLAGILVIAWTLPRAKEPNAECHERLPSYPIQTIFNTPWNIDFGMLHVHRRIEMLYNSSCVACHDQKGLKSVQVRLFPGHRREVQSFLPKQMHTHIHSNTNIRNIQVCPMCM